MNWRNRLSGSMSFRFRKRVTDRLIVIESDDWGMERARDSAGVAWAGHTFGRNRFSRWTTDALETPEDLELLFSVFNEAKFWFAQPPVLTANFITHNPTLGPQHELQFNPLSALPVSLLASYQVKIGEGVLIPQYHGFSHYNTTQLHEYALTKECREAEANGFMLARSTMKGDRNFLHGELTRHNKWAESQLTAGLSEFRAVFGFPSATLMPPTYMLDKELLPALAKAGIRYVQGGSHLRTSDHYRHFRFLLRSCRGMCWGVRNARLDPHPDYQADHRSCLRAIEQAFTDQQPAVIDFHRVNFAGTHTPAYRDHTLTELRSLFRSIRDRWPDARFLSTTQLVDFLHGTPQPN